nr:hypothetical protein [Tanacetum cinerariifolium]
MGQLAEEVHKREACKLPSHPALNPKHKPCVSEHVNMVTSLRNGKKDDNMKFDSELVSDLLKDFPKSPTQNPKATESPKVGEGGVSNTTTPYHVALEKLASARLAKKGPHYEDMWETFKQVNINLPLIDAIKKILAYAKFLKDFCTQKRKPKATSPKKIDLTEHVSTVLSSSLPPKFKDHRAPLISVVVGNITIKKVLLDLDASINILPASLVDKYDLGTLRKTDTIISLADRSTKIPRGTLEDVIVKLDDFYYPVDFFVMDTESPYKGVQPNIILGRPFLATIDARINCRISAMDIAFGEELSQPPIASTEAPHMVSSVKLPIFKKGEYILYTIKMEQYLAHTDYALWKVILDGNSAVHMSKDDVGNEIEVTPVTAQQILARTRERKAKSTLLIAIPDEHLAKFYRIKDAKTLWAAFKTRFDGMLKALDKGYDRFQRLLSLLEIHEASVSTKDANQKFLRSLPSAWSNISLIMRNKPGTDTLDIDDMYNNLKVYESDIKGSSGSSSNSQNVAFIPVESTSNTNELNAAYSVSTATGYSSQAQGSLSYANELMFLCFANQSSTPQLDIEDLEEIDQDDLVEIDHKWQVAMLFIRVKRFYKKTGRKLEFNRKDPVGFDKNKVECFNCHRRGHFVRDCRSARNSGIMNKYDGNARYKGRDNVKRPVKEEDEHALVVHDGLGTYDWSYQVKEEATDFVLMALTSNPLSSSSSNSKEQSCSKQCEQSYAQLKTFFDEQREKLSRANIEIIEEEVIEIVFDNRSSNEENSVANDRFKKGEGYHAVTPPLTGNYMPPKPDLSFPRLDDSIYKFKISETVTSLAKDKNDAPETSTAFVVKPKEDRSSAPLVKDWETTSDDDSVFTPEPTPAKIDFVKSGESIKRVKPVESVKHVKPVKTAKQTDKSNNFSSSPKVDKQNWNGKMTQKLGLGFRFTRKACFLCGSLSHLIKDYTFHENRMAKKSMLPTNGTKPILLIIKRFMMEVLLLLVQVETQAPRNHIGGGNAQTRFETASKKSSEPSLSTCHTVRSREDKMEQETNLTDFVPPTPYDSPISGGHTPGSDEVIKRLQKKVKRLEKKQRARTLRIKLYQISASKKKTLDKENVSKHAKDESNRIEELNLSNKGSDETEVFDYTTTAEKDVNAAEPVSTAGDAINVASVILDVSVAGPSISTAKDIFKDEMTTMADTLMAITRTRPRTTSVVIHDVEEEQRRATPPSTVQSQEKETAQRLFEEEQAQFERKQRIAREKGTEQEAKDAALIEQIEDIQERIDADALLAKKLQQEEREQFTVDEQAKILVDLIAKRKRFFAAQRDKKIRNKPLTKAQLKNKMVTYLKHMGKYTRNQLKSKSFEEIQMLYESEQKWINDFVLMDSEEVNDSKQQAKGSKKRSRVDHDKKSVKKQKLEEDNAKKRNLELV